jgi:hypothetical protein
VIKTNKFYCQQCNEKIYCGIRFKFCLKNGTFCRISKLKSCKEFKLKYPHSRVIINKTFCISGVYFAEHSSKSVMYSWGVGGGCPAHRSSSCFDCTRMMLLCKVALGRKMLTPEYVNCLPAGVDTIVAKPGVINAGLAYTEYIVYHQDQVRSHSLQTWNTAKLYLHFPGLPQLPD